MSLPWPAWTTAEWEARLADEPTTAAALHPLHVVADAHQAKLEVALRYAFAVSRRQLPSAPMTSEAQAKASVSALAAALRDVMPDALAPVISAGAQATTIPAAVRTAGGPGSGDFGHEGRPGEVGGSGGGGGYKDTAQGVDTRTESANAVSDAKTGQLFHAVLYRGVDPKESEKANRTPSQFAEGEYRSPFPEVAGTYGQRVVTVPTTLKNPYVMTLGEGAYFNELRKEFGTNDPERITAQLRDDGHDGLIVKNVPMNRGELSMRDSAEVIVFDHLLKSLSGPVVRTAEYDESDHPRDEKGQWTFYHGTSDVHETQITTEGLRPRKGPLEQVYLTSSVEDALAHAKLTAQDKGGRPIIFRVDVPEDYRKNVVKSVYNQYRYPDAVPASWMSRHHIPKTAEDFRTLKKTKPLTMKFEATNPRVQEAAQQQAAKLVTDVTRATRQAIHDAVVKHVGGESSDRAYFDAINTAIGDASRAQLIARTETMRAANTGQRFVFDDARDDGLIAEDAQLEWIATEDGVVCPICEALDGERIGFDEGFDVDGDILDYPPAHPNCRCTVGLVP